MRSCEYWQERISALLDGELPRQEKAELMEHLAACDACRAVFEDYTAMGDALSGEEVAAPEGFTGAVMDRVRLTPQEKPKQRRAGLHWRRWAATAACCAIAAVGVWGMNGGEKAATESAPEAVNTAAVTAEEAHVPMPAAELPEAESYSSSNAPQVKAAPALRDDAPQEAGGSTLPGGAVLLWEGRRYVWAAVADSIPPAYERAGQLQRVDALTADGQLQADFEASGEIYDDPDTDHAVYVRITTPWLEEAAVRFDAAEE